MPYQSGSGRSRFVFFERKTLGIIKSKDIDNGYINGYIVNKILYIFHTHTCEN